MSGHDDLDRWGDDAIVRALRAPGTAHELADRERYVAAFRASRTSRSNVSPLRRGVRRLGAGGTTVIAVVALSSGVAAAAYTRHLPGPVQRVVHDVLGAPAPRTTPQRSPERTPRPHPEYVARGADVGTHHLAHPASGARHGRTFLDVDLSTHTGTHADTHAGTHGNAHVGTDERAHRRTPDHADRDTNRGPDHPVPTAPLPAPEPAAVSVSGSSHRATPARRRRCRAASVRPTARRSRRTTSCLQRRGPHRWLRVAVATADDSGAVSFATPPADATATYRLVGAPGVRSDVWRIVLVPVTATSRPRAGGRRDGHRRGCPARRPGRPPPAGSPPAAAGRPLDGGRRRHGHLARRACAHLDVRRPTAGHRDPRAREGRAHRDSAAARRPGHRRRHPSHRLGRLRDDPW